MYDIHDFVKDLKFKHKLFSQKQCLVIENLYIYINNSTIYRICININPNLLKKASKLGLPQEHIIHNNIHTKIDLEPKFQSSSLILIYNPNNANCNIFPGEESEQSQIAKIKRTSLE